MEVLARVRAQSSGTALHWEPAGVLSIDLAVEKTAKARSQAWESTPPAWIKYTASIKSPLI